MNPPHLDLGGCAQRTMIAADLWRLVLTGDRTWAHPARVFAALSQHQLRARDLDDLNGEQLHQLAALIDRHDPDLGRRYRRHMLPHLTATPRAPAGVDTADYGRCEFDDALLLADGVCPACELYFEEQVWAFGWTVTERLRRGVNGTRAVTHRTTPTDPEVQS